jgi:hypothetical protein
MSTFLASHAVRTIVAEIFEGARPNAAWVINPGDAGLIAWLRSLTPEQASTRRGARSSVAAHANHLRFHLELLNRFSQGEEPFSTADWTTSWQKQSVSAEEWSVLVDELARRADDWQFTLADDHEWDPVAITGAIASAAHMAYHFGAMRQIAAEG